jgi:hypothetical protein
MRAFNDAGGRVQPLVEIVMRQLLYDSINWAFGRAPNSLLYLQHRWRRRGRIEQWWDADYYIIHIPKTGGQSIAHALGRKSPSHFVYSDLPFAFRDRIRNRLHVSVIRPPVDRLRSTFRYAVMLQRKWPTSALAALAGHQSFSEFVKALPRAKAETHYFLRPAVAFFRGAPLDRLRLIPFDRMQPGIDQLHDELGLPRVWLPHKNRTEEIGNLDLELDGEAEAVIHSIYEQDFALYEAIDGRPMSRILDLGSCLIL